MVASAIPGVGPLIGQAVSAATTIFGGTQMNKEGDAQPTVLRDLSEIKAIIKASSDEMKNSLKELGNAIKNESQENAIHQLVKDCKADLTPCIDYFNNKSGKLNELTPYYGVAHFESFVSLNNPETELRIYRRTLFNLVANMKDYLKSNAGGAGSAQLLDIFLLAATWLLLYDKTFLTLWGYVAQNYLSVGTYTNYIRSIERWTEALDEIRTDTRETVVFLIGKRDEVTGAYQGGFISECREARLRAMTPPAAGEGAEDVVSFVDTWPKSAVGYVIGEAKAGIVDNGKRPLVTASYTAYYTAQLNCFDVATKPALLAADRWEAALSSWNEKVPLSPKSAEYDHAAQQATIKVTKGGYPEHYVLKYAVSYVTYQGEGFLSPWSKEAFPTKERCQVQVKVKRVQLPPSDYAKFLTDHNGKAKIDKEAIASVIRRVYVQAAINDEMKVYFIGELSGKPDPEDEDYDVEGYDTIMDNGDHVKPPQ